jgi:hypothetical protein
MRQMAATQSLRNRTARQLSRFPASEEFRELCFGRRGRGNQLAILANVLDVRHPYQSGGDSRSGARELQSALRVAFETKRLGHEIRKIACDLALQE